MKYFLDNEFIEGFHRPFMGRDRHHIDIISIGLVREDGAEYFAINSGYNFNEANDWVKANVITPLFHRCLQDPIDGSDKVVMANFQRIYGKPIAVIAQEILNFIGEDADISFHGYYADYDWVLFCSLFGTMKDLPEGFPMYCNDIKQTMDFVAGLFVSNKPQGVIIDGLHSWYNQCLTVPAVLARMKEHPDYPVNLNEHDALADARWNKALYNFMQRHLQAYFIQ